MGNFKPNTANFARGKHQNFTALQNFQPYTTALTEIVIKFQILSNVIGSQVAKYITLSVTYCFTESR